MNLLYSTQFISKPLCKIYAYFYAVRIIFVNVTLWMVTLTTRQCRHVVFCINKVPKSSLKIYYIHGCNLSSTGLQDRDV